MFLEIKNLTSGYGGNEVLKNLSISIDRGDIVALIGPNGAGKSTVLKSIAGLANIKSGEIFWQDNLISRLSTHLLLNLGIGFVPQGRLVFPGMTVLENLEMGGFVIRDKNSLKNNLKKVFEYFPVLKSKEKLRAGLLSGGEQQMLSIGRSLMTSPKLLMLDEPSLGLSPKATADIFQKLIEINKSGAALLIVEQNVRLVSKYAKRGYLLTNGLIKFSGTALELSSERLMREAYLM